MCPCLPPLRCLQLLLRAKVLTLTSGHPASVPCWECGCRAADRMVGVLLLSDNITHS